MQSVAERATISDLLTRPYAAKPNVAVAQAQGKGFSSLVGEILQKKSTGARAKDVEDLMADLDSAERDFADEPSRDRYDEYKKSVKALCALLLNRSYRLHGYEDKKQRRYETIKIIDARLAQLYTGLIRRNQDVVIALHLMGQIRGLIFDLKA